MNKEQVLSGVALARLAALEEFRDAVLKREAADKKLLALSTAKDLVEKMEGEGK